MAITKNEVVNIGKDEGEQRLSFTKEELETLKRTVAKDANPDEFKMFMYLAKTYGLDPFANEIFFWKIDDKPIWMTSRDGYLSIANNNPNYDGIVSDVIRENDKFVKKTDTVEHQYGTKRGQIVGAYAWFTGMTVDILVMPLLLLRSIMPIPKYGKVILQP